MWEIWTQRLPWQHVEGPFFSNKLLQRLQAGERPPDPLDAPEPYVKLMHACWAQDPEQRPSFAEVVSSEVFGSVGSGSAARHSFDPWCVLPEAPR